MSYFETKAVWLIARLLKDFPMWGVDECCACAGNGGGESGLRAIQEAAVPAPNGGFGWFQWTGVRRTAFFAFCKAKGMLATDDEANYLFLREELMTTERSTVARVKNAMKGVSDPDDLYAKTVMFEEAFERAGIKNWTGRYDFAKRAKAAWMMVPQTKDGPLVPNVPIPITVKPMEKSSMFGNFSKLFGALLGGGISGGLVTQVILPLLANNIDYHAVIANVSNWGATLTSTAVSAALSGLVTYLFPANKK